MLTREQDRLIRAEASQTLDDLGLATYPIDPDAIAKAKQLSVRYVNGMPDGVFGALCRKNNRYQVLVSNQCPTDGLRRFTLAHELAHYILPGHAEKMFHKADETIPSVGGNYRRKDPLEIEADTFASELLLPDRFARGVVRAGRPSTDSIISLSNSFEVSVSAGAIRTVELTDEPMAVILSHNGFCEWCARSPSLAHLGWSLRSLKNDHVPRGSPTDRLASNATGVAQCDRDDDMTPLNRWFDDAPAELEVIEEAVGLGAYGRVLTTLTFENLPDTDELYVHEQRRQREHWEREDNAVGSKSARGDWRRPLRSFQWDEEEE